MNSLRVGAINFHTAPPRWPGRGSCSFALLAGDKSFGVTAHLMTEEIDSGPILHVLRFRIEVSDTAETLNRKALEYIPKLVLEVVSNLQANNWTPVPSGEVWERKALRQKDLEKVMHINDNDSEEAVIAKIRAFSHSKKPGPYVIKYGRKFWYLS